jgi:GT2 family glycosyltransferase
VIGLERRTVPGPDAADGAKDAPSGGTSTGPAKDGLSAESAAPAALFDVSIIIVSFNTREILRECLTSVLAETAALHAEILVVDNASTDGSREMIQQDFPQVTLLKSLVNLGFGAANNLALRRAHGRYFVLLNSDAFFAPGALTRAIEHMEQTPECGLGGCRLVGRDGAAQPSSRCFHSIFNDALVLTGLAARFPKSRLFGRFDRTWADPMQPAPVDWVPGAFTILRPEALAKVGLFDPKFFLYYEEVDLCLRFKRAGIQVWYWPDIVVTHIGGESSRQLKALDFSSHAAQVVLWRMRSTFLYYRKHHGAKVHLARWLEAALYGVTVLRNHFSRDPIRQQRKRHYRTMLALIHQAWNETDGGRVSPPRPW